MREGESGSEEREGGRVVIYNSLFTATERILDYVII